MKSKKIMIISLVAVLALAMMGFGFAKWSDYVKFEGSVATGNVGVNIEAGETTDLGADPNYPPGDNWEGKDVASCTVTTECNTTLVVNIENAYPWYKPGFSFRINGLGTVPVKVEELKILACQDPKGLGSADASKCLKILRVQKLAFLSPIPKFFRKISVLHVAAHPFQAILLLLTYYSTFKWAYG
jgi:hypothetical protein